MIKKHRIHPIFFIATLLTASIMFFSFCIITNSQGFFRKYLDSDIPFDYQLHNSTSPDWVAAIDAGAQSWEDLNSSYWEFENGGFTSVGNLGRDNINLVFFDQNGVNFPPPPTNVIAFSSTWTTGSGANLRAVESDLIWNARDFPPGTMGQGNLIDLEGTMAHEFGHHLGIGHTGPVGGPPGCGPLITAATMYGTVSTGDTTQRSLHIDDIGAVSMIYPSWMLEGSVTDANNGQPLGKAEVTSPEVFGAYISGPVESPQTGRYQIPGLTTNSLPLDTTNGTFSAAVLEQQVNLEAKFFGYQSQSAQVSFNPPGGIGQTETIAQNFALQPNPVVQLTGAVVDSATNNPIQATVEIFAISNKPGLPQGAVDSTTTGNNGEFSLTVPAREDYRIVVTPESPYPSVEQLVHNLPVGGEQVTFELNPAQLMLVDDDQGNNYESFFIEALDNISATYHWWSVDTDGSPTLADFNEYPGKLVLWFTGDGNDSTLTLFEQEQLLAHINSGGKLFVTGQNIAEQNSGSPLLNRLGLTFSQNSNFPIVTGAPNDIGAGLTFSTLGSGGAGNQNSRDQLAISDSTITRTVFVYGTNQSATAGVAAESDSGRAVFLGFGFEAINEANLRAAVMDAIIAYLEETVTGIQESEITENLPSKFELSQNYPNPFNPTTTIRFSIPQLSRVNLKIFNGLGQQVTILTDRVYTAGNYELQWNGRDGSGTVVSSGIYFYRLTTASGFQQIKKMMLLK